ncbi:MAG TPA: C-terminal binding protein [Dehalococcoidia bacterium]|nr:C-terminal binding protein [Dehalococcoidia bacterium]
MAEKTTDRYLVVHADADAGGDYGEERTWVESVGAEFRLTNAREEEVLIANVRDADVVVVNQAPITRRVMEALPRCRCVVRYGVGVDNVEVAAATDLGIVVANVVDFCTEEVANHALLLLLACAKRLLPLDADLRAGHWRRTPLAGMPPVWGQTLGIIGLGNIGRSLARKALALQMTLLGYDPYAQQAPEGVRLVALRDLLAQSDFVSVCAPLTADTRHLIGAAELASMKPSAILINTARGPLVDEGALVEALRSGRIAAAGLDVFEEEPLPAESPVLGLTNVVLTGHTAGMSGASVRRVKTEVGQAAGAVLSGRWPKSVVNPTVQPRVALARG